jgi:hypothetical protein
MRRATVNPLPHVPRTDLERTVCEKIQSRSGEVVLEIWSPDTYPFEDAQGNRVRLEADFAVRTGRLTGGLYASGSTYLAFVRGDQIEVVFEGAWTS